MATIDFPVPGLPLIMIVLFSPYLALSLTVCTILDTASACSSLYEKNS